MNTKTARQKWWWIIYAAFLFLSSAATAQAPAQEVKNTRAIYLVNHGWHAGIVVKRADIPPGVWTEQEDFSESEYLEVGWGDRDYYIEPDPHLGITLKAALWPTQSVLHIAAFSGSVMDYFKDREIVAIGLTAAGFEKLCRYFQESYARDDAGRVVRLGPGLYGQSRFYLSRETYHLLKTCNVWTARALATAGLPITAGWTIRMEDLMAEVKKFGAPVQAAPATGTR